MTITPRNRSALISLVVACGLVGVAGPAFGGDQFLPPLQYPPQVEQGETFTVSGTGCVMNDVGGNVLGSIVSGWSNVDVMADSNGDWSAQLTVPLDQPLGTFEWDLECMFDESGQFYPFDEIEIVPQVIDTTTTETTPDSTAPPTTGTPSTTAAPATSGPPPAPQIVANANYAG